MESAGGQQARKGTGRDSLAWTNVNGLEEAMPMTKKKTATKSHSAENVSEMRGVQTVANTGATEPVEAGAKQAAKSFPPMSAAQRKKANQEAQAQAEAERRASANRAVYEFLKAEKIPFLDADPAKIGATAWERWAKMELDGVALSSRAALAAGWTFVARVEVASKKGLPVEKAIRDLEKESGQSRATISRHRRLAQTAIDIFSGDITVGGMEPVAVLERLLRVPERRRGAAYSDLKCGKLPDPNREPEPKKARETRTALEKATETCIQAVNRALDLDDMDSRVIVSQALWGGVQSIQNQSMTALERIIFHLENAAEEARGDGRDGVVVQIRPVLDLVSQMLREELETPSAGAISDQDDEPSDEIFLAVINGGDGENAGEPFPDPEPGPDPENEPGPRVTEILCSIALPSFDSVSP